MTVQLVKRATRFSDTDLHERTVSGDRILEIVSRIIPKVDEKKYRIQDLERMTSKLISDVEKIFIYKKAETPTQDENREIANYQHNLDEIAFFNKIIISNIKLAEFEIAMEHYRFEEKKKVMEERMLDLTREKDKKHHDEQHYLMALNQLQKDKIHDLILHRDALYKHFQELKMQEANLRANIQENQKIIRESRRHHSATALKYADDVKVNNAATFEGMSPKQKEAFFNGSFEIEEIAARRISEINANYDKQIQDLSNGHRKAADKQGVRYSPSFEITKQINAIENRRTSDIKAVEDSALQAYKRLGDRSGCTHINSSVPEHEFKAHHSAFRNHKHIKHNIDTHRNVTTEKTRENINNFKQIEVIVDKEREVLKSIVKDSQKIDQDSKYLDPIEKQEQKNIASEIKESFTNVQNFELSGVEGISINDCSLHEIGNGVPDLSDINLDDLEFYENKISLDQPADLPSRPSV